jgi:hypothetical protein
MVHVGLDELERLILNHPNCLVIQLRAEQGQLFWREALLVLGGLEGSCKDLLNVLESADRSTHAQAEVSEPLMVECDCPVFA